MIVPFVSLWLVFHHRIKVFAEPRTDWTIGILTAFIGSLMVLFPLVAPSKAPAAHLSYEVTVFLMLWLGTFVFVFGRRALWNARFAAFFLVFAIPLPHLWLEAANEFLKHGSAEGLALLAPLTGQAVHREGFIFWFPSFAIEVGDDCTGIRSAIALLLVAVIMSHSCLTAWYARAMFLILVPFIAVAKNAVRIAVLSVLAAWIDPSYLTGNLHRDGGIVYFALGLALLYCGARLLGRTESIVNLKRLLPLEAS